LEMAGGWVVVAAVGAVAASVITIDTSACSIRLLWFYHLLLYSFMLRTLSCLWVMVTSFTVVLCTYSM
jgi:hypothetical protein